MKHKMDPRSRVLSTGATAAHTVLPWSRRSAAVVLAGLLLGLCGDFPLFQTDAAYAKDASKTVKVGVILPLTGQLATFGKESLNGLNLALEQTKGSGSTIELFVEDTRSTVTDSAAAINKLITSDKVAVVIGEVASSNTIAATSAAESNKIPLMTHASTNDSITTGKSYVSRICFVDSFQGQVMAKFAAADLKAKTAAILLDSDSDYSRGLRDSFSKAFQELGGKVSVEVSYSQKDTDFKAQLGKVRRSKPDVVFVPGYYTQVGAILRQAKELGIKATFLGTDGWDSPAFFEIAGDAAAGHYLSNHFAPDDTDAKVQKFVTEYKAKYGSVPGAMAALAYDAGFFMRDVLKRTATGSSEEIKNAISGTKGFEGLTGTITLDDNRNAIKAAVILKTTKTGNTFFKRVNP
jgi:branched-chain amino acid transport system substrate-binding protein